MIVLSKDMERFLRSHSVNREESKFPAQQTMLIEVSLAAK